MAIAPTIPAIITTNSKRSLEQQARNKLASCSRNNKKPAEAGFLIYDIVTYYDKTLA